MAPSVMHYTVKLMSCDRQYNNGISCLKLRSCPLMKRTDPGAKCFQKHFVQSRCFVINACSLAIYVILHLLTNKNDVIIIVKLCIEPRAVKFDNEIMASFLCVINVM